MLTFLAFITFSCNAPEPSAAAKVIPADLKAKVKVDSRTTIDLTDDVFTSAFQDRSGNIWFGTNGNRNGGLDRGSAHADGQAFSL